MELTFSLISSSPFIKLPHTRRALTYSYSYSYSPLVQCTYYLSSIQLKPPPIRRRRRRRITTTSNSNSNSNSNSCMNNTTATEDNDQPPLFDLDEFEDSGSPWEGAVIYKRKASINHLEYCTTLERLGLGALSTDLSKSTASSMGLRVTKQVKDFPTGTPVQISLDVTRIKNTKKLKLDGIIKTVISLYCNRCGNPTGQTVFSNFSLLLSEDPIQEPDIINLGVIYGDDTDDEDDESSIDFDDRFYFPPEQNEIDISKNIRDTIHVEITINGVCDPMCKGACLKCGQNLNTSTCKCTKESVTDRKGYGPLGNLREKLQTK